MSNNIEKIDDNLDNLTPYEYLIEHQKIGYRVLNLLSEEQIDELISIQDPKEHSKKLQKFIRQSLEQKKNKK